LAGHVLRSIYEGARDMARNIASSDDGQRNRSSTDISAKR
jgi:hypothetical protein